MKHFIASALAIYLFTSVVQSKSKEFKHDKPVLAVAFSPDGKSLADISSDQVVLWDVTSGKELKRLKRFADQAKPTVARRLFFEGPPSYPPEVAIAPDGKTAEGTWDFDSGWRATHRWDVTTGKELKVTLQDSKGDGWFPAIKSPDGKIWAKADVDYSKKWIAGTPPNPGKNILLSEVTSGKQLRQLNGHAGKITALTFSPSGKLLASGSEDKFVRLWTVATGKELRRLEGHQYTIRALAFSRDGKALATGGDDGTLRIWAVSDR